MSVPSLAAINADEQTFYAITQKAWNECSEAQKVFSAFNSIYTPEYITTQIKALQAAKDLPNQEARLAIQTRMRTILEGKAFMCNNLVQNLYVIITRSFPEGEVNSMRQEAGSGYYNAAASGENWNSADTLYTMVSAFFITYGEELTNGNMPANFPASFTEAQTAFSEAYSKYSEARDNVTKGAAAKNEANTAVHTPLMRMLADGKAIYRNEPAKKKFFVYTHLKTMVAGPGKTGIRFSLKQNITKLPIANASITLQPGNYIIYPDKKGIVTQLLSAGTYTYTITAPGETTITGSIKIKGGSVQRANILFTKTEVTKPVATTGTDTTGINTISVKAS